MLFIENAIKQLRATERSLHMLNFVKFCPSGPAFWRFRFWPERGKPQSSVLWYCMPSYFFMFYIVTLFYRHKNIVIICWCIQHPEFEWDRRWDFFCLNAPFQKLGGTSKHSRNSKLLVWSFATRRWYDLLDWWCYTNNKYSGFPELGFSRILEK